MPEPSQEITERDVYTMYPPVADWVVEAVPAKSGNACEASPLLYSPHLATTTIREALVYMEQSFVRDENGDVVAYDASQIAAEDLAIVQEGAMAIRDNTELPKGVREPAIGILQAMKVTVNGNPRTEEIPYVSAPSKSKRAAQVEARQQQELEAQREHEEDRARQLEVVMEWIEEHPPQGSGNFLRAQELLPTSLSKEGQIKIREKKGYAKNFDDFTELFADPNSLPDEITDAISLATLFQTHKLPVMQEVFDYQMQKLAERWLEPMPKDSLKVEEAYREWLSLFTTFSEEFKNRKTYFTEPLKIDSSLDIDDDDNIHEALVHRYAGIRLTNLLVHTADKKSKDFLKSVHNIARQANEGEDFAFYEVMFQIGRVLRLSKYANTLLINAVAVNDVDDSTKLRNADLLMAIRKLGYTQPGNHDLFVKRRSKLPKIVRKYGLAVEEIALAQGLDVWNDLPAKERLTDALFRPFTERVLAGELSDSLYKQVA